MTIEQTAGEYRIIRINGDEYTVKAKPTIRAIADAIHAQTVDTVTLNRNTMVIMIVDDTGMLDNKPVNPKATELARQAFGQQYPHSIHGDVAIVNDEDFA